MLRRPLAPNPRDEGIFTTPFERASDVASQLFGRNTDYMPPYMQHAGIPLKTYNSPEEIAATLGLPELPQGWSRRYPLKPIGTQHPTTFLQLGWLTNGHKQIHFEMGDGGYLVSIHFIKARPGDNGTSWHLDFIEMNDGREETYSLDCTDREADPEVPVYDDLDYGPHIDHLMDAVKMATTLLCRDNWQGASQIFHDAVRTITKELDDFSVAAAAQHAANSWSRPPVGNSGGQGNTPATKLRS